MTRNKDSITTSILLGHILTHTVSVLEVTVLHQVKFVDRVLLQEVRAVDGQGVVVIHGVLLQRN